MKHLEAGVHDHFFNLFNTTKVAPTQQEMEDTTLKQVKSWDGQKDKRVTVENDLHFNDWGTDTHSKSLGMRKI